MKSKAQRKRVDGAGRPCQIPPHDHSFRLPQQREGSLRLLTVAEAARTVHTTPKSIHRLTREGRLSCYFIGRKLFSERHIKEYLTRVEDGGDGLAGRGGEA